MINLGLNGDWKMKSTTAAEWSKDWLDVKVPGSVFHDLLSAGRIDDPFYRDNEDEALKIASCDYEYKREFDIGASLLENDRVVLKCEGLDTLAGIRINGRFAGSANNMHREYEFDIKSLLVEGKNEISIIFSSPVEFVQKKHAENPLCGFGDAVEGFHHLRKAHCMFGWDWGPQIPDSGIWRDISIKAYNVARLEDVYITQVHEEGNISLDIRVMHVELSGKPDLLKVKIICPGGQVLESDVIPAVNKNKIHMEIPQPQLWWPNGYGSHPLYEVEVFLKNGDKLLDYGKYIIGLRTMRVRQVKDQWGESFELVVNGIPIFAKGADYIPEDNLLPRCSLSRTERLIKDCVAANFNCIRVWGGGYYPENYFFDLCDRYGMIVWQDLMYACAVYDLSEGDFAENIAKECRDNVKRIRHHACLGLWCGNNEMEQGWADVWSLTQSAKLRTDYIKQFEILLPGVVKETDPNTFYWPSSPSSGGGFDNPNDENRGDVHYWQVWHGLKPFTDYRKYFFRFVSEFGFQSFPSLKTIQTFALPEDRNIFSYVMEKHQKNGAANGKILYYLSDNFKYPKDFDTLLYTSQILQAEAIKYGVEHWRRNRGRCMGAIYWQLNDCWPVASWASIDYFGRWKALHYFAKRFFDMVLVSACEEGTSVELHVTNDTLSDVKGKIIWKLRDNTSQILDEGFNDVNISPLSAAMCTKLDCSGILKDKKSMMKTYLEYCLICNENVVSSGTVLFCKVKHFEFLYPGITLKLEEEPDRFFITVSSIAYAKYVELDLQNVDCIFSDNYFDLSTGMEKTVVIMKDSLSKNLSLVELKDEIKVRSAFNIDQ